MSNKLTKEEMHWSHILDSLHPCHDSQKWMLTQKDPITAWKNCKNPIWMLWIIDCWVSSYWNMSKVKVFTRKNTKHKYEQKPNIDEIYDFVDNYIADNQSYADIIIIKDRKINKFLCDIIRNHAPHPPELKPYKAKYRATYLAPRLLGYG